ncbi:MAG: oxidoreductase [Bacteroidetes bacterium]|nr:oxidoreductase [Bacteroidota bacterium]MBL6963421.1 oxidoreductase [Bacteroidota bacterium]
MNSKTAVIFGSTGLIGVELINLFIEDDYWEKAEVFLRQALPITSNKISQHVTNFEKLDQYAHLIKGDVLFICLGTTMKNAGSKEAFRYVDFELPYKVASIAHANGVKTLLLVSSLGANPQSSNFYLRTKGEIESKLQSIGFESYYFFRPSILFGKRNSRRKGENFGKFLVRVLKFALVGKLRKYRGVKASAVAFAMNHIAKNGFSNKIIESEQIIELEKS